LRFVALFSLLLVGSPAQAVDYILSDTSTSLPPGVTVVSPGNYSGGVLTLGVGDTIAIGDTKPATITFTGAFTTGANCLINATGPASDLTVIATGALTLGANSVLNANVTATAAVNIGIGSTLGGSITTTSPTGVVTLAADSWVGGAIQTDAGAVTVGDSSTVGGPISTIAGVVVVGANIEVNGGISTIAGGISIGAGSYTVGGGITTEAGVVTLTTDVKIDGDITTIAGGISIGAGSSTCGSVITTGAGVITLGANVQIGGSISTVAGAITVNAGSTVGGDIIPTGAGVVTLTGALVGGKIETGAGAINVSDSRVGGTVSSTGGGVVTILTSMVEDSTLVVPNSPACAATTMPATVMLDDLVQTYTGGSLEPTVTTVPTPLAVILTGAPQTNAGSYPVTATVDDSMYQGSASATFVINKAPATVTLSGLTQTYDGSLLKPTATTDPAGLFVDLTGAPQTAVGTYPVTATINDPNYEGSTSGTFVISMTTPTPKTPATVTLANLVQTYGGSALMPTATTDPTGLTVIWTGAPQTNAGYYIVTATIDDPNYQGTTNGVFVINKAPATITFEDMTVGYTGQLQHPDAGVVPDALDLFLVWTTGGNAEQDGGKEHTAVGNYPVTVTLTHPNYEATASGTFVISGTTPPATATVTLSNLVQTYTGSPLMPTATTVPPGLTVIWTGAPQTDAGYYIVTATIDDATYQGTATGVFVINKAVVPIIFEDMKLVFNGSLQHPHAGVHIHGNPALETLLDPFLVWTRGINHNHNHNHNHGNGHGNGHNNGHNHNHGNNHGNNHDDDDYDNEHKGVGNYPVTVSINHPNYQGTASGTFMIVPSNN
jgi:hypothetical protein